MTYRGKYLNRGIGTTIVVALVTAGAIPAWAAFSTTPDALPGFNGTVLAVAYSGNTLFVGGDFTSAVVKGKSIARSRLAAVDARTGELLSWAPAADGRVKALVVSGSAVYAAGDFASVGGQSRDSLAKLDAVTGAVASFKHSLTGKPYALATGSDRLYLGGAFTAVDGQNRTRLAAFSLGSGSLDSSWKPTADDQIEAITATDGRIYVGGKFHKVNGTSGYDRLVALDPAKASIVTGFKPKAPVITYGIAIGPDGVYAAAGGQGGKANAYSTGGTLKWTATFDGDAQAIAYYSGTVYVGGHFDRACKTARTGPQGVCLDGSDDRVKLAALAPSTGKLQAWRADGNGIEGVLTMATTSSFGAMAAGGAFTTVNGSSVKRLAQFS
ncbi:PQQ-binding-like beta-propeller repeat protein [Actinoplanes sp. NPDC049265]|uniref:outer membrane protein assembly factor BamB family protein n=1 Tax=Actinoplanes sp. NPDC049265 TaxID=3363902 RepID=UPI003721D8B1